MGTEPVNGNGVFPEQMVCVFPIVLLTIEEITLIDTGVLKLSKPFGD